MAISKHILNDMHMQNKFRNSTDIFLNLNVRGLHQSLTLAVNDTSIELEHHGMHVYKLGLGQSPFPVPKPVVFD